MAQEPAQENLDDYCVREQFRVVARDLPRLYGTVLVVVGFVVALILPVAPAPLVTAWAVVLIVVASMRGLYWRDIGRRIDGFSVGDMRQQLARVDSLGAMLLVFFASAGLFVLQSPDIVLRVVTMLAIWSATVGTAFYLTLLPRGARGVIWGVTLCTSAVFLCSGGRSLYIATPLFVAVSYGLSIQLQKNYETFNAVVEASFLVDRLRREALALAMTDALTGLPNRRAFDERLQILAAAGHPFAAAVIDLDRFKPVNDLFGHSAGDKALVIVAARLSTLGAKVFVSRFGGDEFVLLIEGADFAEAIVQRAVDTLAMPYDIDGATVCMGASCGLAFWREAGDETDLLRRADAALYLAKSRRQLEQESGNRNVVVRSAA